MNIYALGAAIVLFAGCYIHIIFAGRRVQAEMQADLTGFHAALEALLWHAVSLLLILFFALSVWAVFARSEMMAGAMLFAGVHAAALGLLCLGVSLKRLNSWVGMPQAYLFFLIAGGQVGYVLTP